MLLAGGGSWSRLIPVISTATRIVPEVTVRELHEIQGGLQRLRPWTQSKNNKISHMHNLGLGKNKKKDFQ